MDGKSFWDLQPLGTEPRTLHDGRQSLQPTLKPWDLTSTGWAPWGVVWGLESPGLWFVTGLHHGPTGPSEHLVPNTQNPPLWGDQKLPPICISFA